MRTQGRARLIVEKSNDLCPYEVSRSDYLEEVKTLMRESRGRELPGSYNPLIVGELFGKQCQPWEGIARDSADRILASANTTANAVLQHIADEETAEALFRDIVAPSMEVLRKELVAKVGEILAPHVSGHPITYNHYLTENVQKAQAQRHRAVLEKRMQAFFGRDELVSGVSKYSFDMKSLVNAIATSTEPDMDKYSCSMATDMMEAYYKVSLLLSTFQPT